MDNLKLKEIIFTKTNNKKTVKIDYNFSYFKINKIILKSHINKPPNDWAQIFSETNMQIDLFITDNTHEHNDYNLVQFISLYQILPIIELNAEFPSREARKHLNLIKYYNRIDLTFLIKDENAEFYLYYEEMPGITII